MSMPVQATPYERVMRRTVVTDSGCIEFTGSKTGRGGYGQLSRAGGGSPYKAHRVVFAEVYGPIPDGAFICHHCDNPPCVNPDHLFLGTNQDNVTDMVNKGRHHNQVKTHCKHGHAFTPDNLRAGVGRVCAACRREANRAYRARQREAS